MTSTHLPYRMVTIFSNSSSELISGLDLDQSGAFTLVFGLSQKAQPWTKPKSEVTHCITDRYNTPPNTLSAASGNNCQCMQATLLWVYRALMISFIDYGSITSDSAYENTKYKDRSRRLCVCLSVTTYIITWGRLSSCQKVPISADNWEKMANGCCWCYH